MKLDVTESAVSHLKNVLAQSVDGKGIRLATKASGCSGYAYVLEYAKHSVEDDLVLNIPDNWPQAAFISSPRVRLMVDKIPRPLSRR